MGFYRITLALARIASALYRIFADQVKDEAWAVPSRRYLRKKFHWIPQWSDLWGFTPQNPWQNV